MFNEKPVTQGFMIKLFIITAVLTIAGILLWQRVAEAREAERQRLQKEQDAAAAVLERQTDSYIEAHVRH